MVDVFGIKGFAVQSLQLLRSAAAAVFSDLLMSLGSGFTLSFFTVLLTELCSLVWSSIIRRRKLLDLIVLCFLERHLCRVDVDLVRSRDHANNLRVNSLGAFFCSCLCPFFALIESNPWSTSMPYTAVMPGLFNSMLSTPLL